MRAWLLIGIGAWAVTCHAQPHLTPRRLADIAVIDVPASLRAEDKIKVLAAPSALTAEHGSRYRDDLMERLTFGFSSTYLWASMGSVTAYRQQLIVSVMAPDAPDAPDAEYAQVSRRMGIHLE